METNNDVQLIIPKDIESGTGLHHRNGPIMGVFQRASSYFFSSSSSSSSSSDLQNEEIDHDEMLEKHTAYLIDGVIFSFTTEFMNGVLLKYIASNLLDKHPIMEWDRNALEEELLPSFNSGYIDDEAYWVHPLAPKLAIEEVFDINKFTGNEMSIPFKAITSDGWIPGNSNVWIAELRLVEIECDIEFLAIEIQLKIHNRSDYLPCLCKGNKIRGKGNLLKPKRENGNFVLERNTMCGLYVSGKTKEDLDKYVKACGENKEFVLVERTLTSTILLETVRMSGLADKEIIRSLKNHDGKFYKLKSETWEKLTESVETHLSISPIQDLELKFRMYDGKRWEEVTSAEMQQKIRLRFEIHPVIHFKEDEEERISVIRRLIE